MRETYWKALGVTLAAGATMSLAGIGAVAFADPSTPYTIYIVRAADGDQAPPRLDSSTTGYNTCADVPVDQTCEVSVTAQQWYDVLTKEGMPTTGEGKNAPATVEDVESYLKVLSVLSGQDAPLAKDAWGATMLVNEQPAAAKLTKRYFTIYADGSIDKVVKARKDMLNTAKNDLLKAKEDAKDPDLKTKIDEEIAKIDQLVADLTRDNVKDPDKGAQLKANFEKAQEGIAKLKEDIQKDKEAPTEDSAITQAKADLQKSIDAATTVSGDKDLPADAKAKLDEAIKKAEAAKGAGDATVDSVNAAKAELDQAKADAEKAIADKKAGTGSGSGTPESGSGTGSGSGSTNSGSDTPAPAPAPGSGTPVPGVGTTPGAGHTTDTPNAPAQPVQPGPHNGTHQGITSNGYLGNTQLADTGINGGLLAAIALMSLALIGAGAALKRRSFAD